MSNHKVLFVCKAIVQAIAFICVTIAAIRLNKISVLWFYLVPLCMGTIYKGT